MPLTTVLEKSPFNFFYVGFASYNRSYDIAMPAYETVCNRRNELLTELNSSLHSTLEGISIQQFKYNIHFSTIAKGSLGFVGHADIWSNRVLNSFLGVNIEFMASDFRRVRFTLDLIELHSSHTAELIRHELFEKLKKIVTATSSKPPLLMMMTDNAANMKSGASTDDVETVKILTERFPDLVLEENSLEAKSPTESLLFSFSPLSINNVNGDENNGDLYHIDLLFENDATPANSTDMALVSSIDQAVRHCPGSTKWLGDTAHTFMLAFRPVVKASKSATKIISKGQQFNRILKNSTSWATTLSSLGLSRPILDFEVRWTTLPAMLDRFVELVGPCLNVSNPNLPALPSITPRDIHAAKVVSAIISRVVDCVRAVETADAHCGIVLALIDQLIKKLKKDDAFDGQFKVCMHSCVC